MSWQENRDASTLLPVRPDERAELGGQLRGLRERDGLTQEQLAKKARVGVVTIIRYERGEITKFAELERIASALGVELAFGFRPVGGRRPGGSKLPALPAAAVEPLRGPLRSIVDLVGPQTPPVQQQLLGLVYQELHDRKLLPTPPKA